MPGHAATLIQFGIGAGTEIYNMTNNDNRQPGPYKDTYVFPEK